MLQFITVLTIAVLVSLDQLIKYFAVQYLEPIGSFPVFDGVLQLSYVENTGAAFGSFSKYTTFLSVFTGIVLLGGLIYLLSGRCKAKPAYIAGLMILSGGMGNLVDRILRGYVVDYIEPLFIDFAVFNFADMLVCVGAGFLIIWLIYDMVREARQNPKQNGTETQNAAD